MRTTRLPRYASTARSKTAPIMSGMSFMTYIVLFTGIYLATQILLG
jgi:hypothetical protein